MYLPFFWRGLRPVVHPEDRLGRLRKVLDQANISYSQDSPETALKALAPAPVRRTRRSPGSRQRGGRSRGEQPFQFPLPCPARIALVDAGFPTAPDMRAFAAGDISQIRAWNPEAVVAPLDVALSLANSRRLGQLDLPGLKIAIVVLTTLADSPLADEHRELLWRAFGVPLFEQLRGWDGSVIARECEVHDGLHIDETAAILHLHEDELLATQLTATEEPVIRVRTGWTGEILMSPCECGAETPRLRAISALEAKAASA